MTYANKEIEIRAQLFLRGVASVLKFKIRANCRKCACSHFNLLFQKIKLRKSAQNKTNQVGVRVIQTRVIQMPKFEEGL